MMENRISEAQPLVVKIPKREVIDEDGIIRGPCVNDTWAPDDADVMKHYHLSQAWLPLSQAQISPSGPSVALYPERPYGSTTAVIGHLRLEGVLEGIMGISRLLSEQCMSLRIDCDNVFLVATVRMPSTVQTFSFITPITTTPALTANDLVYLSSLCKKQCLYLLVDTMLLLVDTVSLHVNPNPVDNSCTPDPPPDHIQSVPGTPTYGNSSEITAKHRVPDPTPSLDPLTLNVLVVVTEGVMCTRPPDAMPIKPQLPAHILKVIQPCGYHGYQMSKEKKSTEAYGNISYSKECIYCFLVWPIIKILSHVIKE